MMISVIVPAYNKCDEIEKALVELIEVMEQVGDYEIIVVDDGSYDGTSTVLRRLCEEYELICVFLEKNVGKGNAIREGFLRSKGDIVVFTDADRDLPPSQIP